MIKFLKNTKTNEFRMTLSDDIQKDEVELKANSTDAAVEKHVPEVEIVGKVAKVTVGSTLHPMTPEHYIDSIVLITTDKTIMKKLQPSDQPIAEFKLSEGEKVTHAYAYCNLHGLWVKEL